MPDRRIERRAGKEQNRNDQRLGNGHVTFDVYFSAARSSLPKLHDRIRHRHSERHEALRRAYGGARSVAARSTRQRVRTARPQRRRQDDDDPHDPQHHRARLRARSTSSAARRNDPKITERIGYLPEERGLYKKMQVRRVLQVPRRAEGRDGKRGRPAHRRVAGAALAQDAREGLGAGRRSTSCRAACSRRCSSSARCCTIPIS